MRSSNLLMQDQAGQLPDKLQNKIFYQTSLSEYYSAKYISTIVWAAMSFNMVAKRSFAVGLSIPDVWAKLGEQRTRQGSTNARLATR